MKEEVQHIKQLSKEQFEELLHVSELLNSAAYEESLMEQALDWVIGVINAERGLFVKYNEADNSFSIISARNVGKESIANLSEFSSGVLQQVVQNKKPLLYHDAQTNPNVSQFVSIQLQKIKSVIGVPIVRNEQIWGVILADSQSNRKEFTETNLIFLHFFSNLVSLALDKISRLEHLQNENQILLNKLDAIEQLPDIVGESKSIRELATLIHKVARTDATVLILGESGTGKDLVAQAIHKLSSRKEKPFLAQFCGSIPDNLLESELFGYKKGAFTGANADKKGLLEVADKGTFFLDEIADISPALQAKLLRVLENREIIRLGDTQTKKIDVRILAATNKDLPQLVKEGKFREDLFYRLNIFPLTLPPLRERREDIGLLANFFIRKFGNTSAHLSTSALQKLERFQFPGNIRQLVNIIQRALILCDGEKISDEHIILEERKDALDFQGTLEEFEMRLLKKRLEEFNGNKTQTAASLGVSVRWIQLKLKEEREQG
ncbi:MAG: sigma 54-interacting transcriptional regulator [Ignavibacteriales bacterium]|nr:sigma 54-interacting transcriptional regulator [Ignavibacteriales bacterium]